MEIIDAQIHGLTPSVPWGEHFSENDAIAAGAELAIASMDAVGVAGAVVQSWRTEIAGYIARHPGRFAGVPFAGWPEPEPEQWGEFIAGAAAAGMVGTRLLVSAPEDRSRVRLLRDGAFAEYLAASERHRLPVFMLAHGALSVVRDVVRSFPDLPIILDHLGLGYPSTVPSSEPEIFDDIAHVLELARWPNVVLKLTSAPALSAQPYPYADLWPHLRRLIDAFGLDRIMWGSDFTQVRDSHTYRESVDFVLLSDELATTDKEMLLSGTLRRWLDWSPRDVEV